MAHNRLATLLVFLVPAVLCKPQAFYDPYNTNNSPNGHVLLNAVDLSPSLSSTSWLYTCFKEKGYSAAFIEVYKSELSGDVNTHAAEAIKHAEKAGLGVEVYMSVVGDSLTKSADRQVDDTVEYLKKHSLTVGRIWIKVTWIMNWSMISTSKNLDFINHVIRRLRHHGIAPGIFTSQNDWTRITGNAHLDNNIWLWYTNSVGLLASDSPKDFGDYQTFGGFVHPMVKQYAVNKLECGALVNKNVYRGQSGPIIG